MSAFSKSARSAMSSMQGQFIAGEKSQIALKEDSEKLTQLASKLQWAKLVEEMSDSSKVIILKEPQPLKDWQYASPKVFLNIVFGIVLGIIGGLIAAFIAEFIDKKLTYSMLGDEIIYNLDKEFSKLSADVMSNVNQNKAFVFFEDVSANNAEKLKNFKNTIYIKADISNEFAEAINGIDSVVVF